VSADRAALDPLDPPVRTWADAEAWIEDVRAGRFLVGELVRAAVERHVRDLEEGEARGLWFDVDAANARLEFCASNVHTKDGVTVRVGDPFVPEPWQCFVLGSAHGWKRVDGRRRFTLIYLELGKKNGKTFMLAGEGLWDTAFDGVAGAEVVSIATKEDQARLSWEPAEKMVAFSPELQQVFRVNRGRIIDDETGSVWRVLGSDSKTEDGINPSVVLADEIHRHPDGELFEMCRGSMAARREPLVWATTTAGAGRESFCWSLRTQCEKVVRGLTRDDAVFAFIACPDKGDDWRTETAWRKANPSLGATITLEFLEEECRKAQQNTRLENTFRRYHCNEWTEQLVRWLPMAKWDQCSSVEAGNWEKAAEWRAQLANALAGEQAYSGFDLGRTSDLCAIAHLFPPRKGRLYEPEKWIVLPHFWLPSGKLDPETGEADGVPYREWEKLGFVTIVEGDAIVSDDLEHDVVEFCAPFRLIQVPYDPAAGARDLAVRLQDRGMPMLEYSQGWANISPAAKKLEELILTTKLEHGGNPVLRWNAANAVVKVDSSENLKPQKGKSSGRIDGVSALINAIGVATLKRARRVPYVGLA